MTSRIKDGKVHRYWSIVENHRLAGGRDIHRDSLDVGDDLVEGACETHVVAQVAGVAVRDDRVDGGVDVVFAALGDDLLDHLVNLGRGDGLAIDGRNVLREDNGRGNHRSGAVPHVCGAVKR